MPIHADRVPLRAELLRARLVEPNGPYAALGVVPSTGSTNTDLAAAARADAPDRTVLIAEQQTEGRGRQGRSWVSPPGAGLYVSVLFRLGAVEKSRFGWLPLLAGVALVYAIRETTRVHANLKWPNDLLVGPDQRKCAGILAEMVGGQAEPAAVLGIGLNVAHEEHELPEPSAGLPPTSLALAGSATRDRELLATAILTELHLAEHAWRQHAGDPTDSGIGDAYRLACATIGKQVRVELPPTAEAPSLTGTAVAVDDDGRLVVTTPHGAQAISAGDVVHVRPG